MADINIGINAKGADVAARGLMNVGKSAKHLERDMGGLGAAAKGLQSAFAPLLAVFAGFKAFQAVTSTISASNEAFLIQEKAARGATDAQKDFASQMQGALGIGDEVSLGLMKQAAILGISKEQTDEATQAAIGLSQATGQGLEESLKKVSQAMNGNANAFAEVIPSISNMATEQEKLAAINELATRGLAEQAASMQGLEGIQTRATNSWGDMLEVIGEIMAPIQALISQGFAVFAETMQSALVPALDMARLAMANLGPALEFVTQAVVGGITLIEVVIGNFPSIIEAGLLQAELYWVQFSESVKHILTSAIPQYFEWAKANWMALMTDAVSAVGIIATNHFSNLLNVYSIGFEKAIDLITFFKDNWVSILASGGHAANAAVIASMASFATEAAAALNVNLLEGFESSTQSLPEIIGRQITDREQDLAAQVGKIGAKIGDEFVTKFDGRMKSAMSTFADFELQANLSANTAAGVLEKASKASALQATESRLLTRGGGDQVQQKIEANTALAVKRMEESNAKQERIARKLEAQRTDAAFQLELVSG